MTGARLRVATLALAAVALAVRLGMLLHDGGLMGAGEYDDGVYYAAADALVHGRWPYAEVLLLQPPGIVLVLLPFAAFGALAGDPVGLAAARLAFVGLGVLATVLTVRVLARFGTVAAVVGGSVAAVGYSFAGPQRTALLEPLGTVLLLTGLLLVQRREHAPPRAVVLAGVALGAAVDTKLWCAVPLLVVLVAEWRLLPRLAGGAAAGAVIPVLPFAIAAPAELVRQVVLAQVGRPRDPSTTRWQRLEQIVGARGPTGDGPLPGVSPDLAMAVLLPVVVLAVLAASRTPEARRFAALLGATTAVLLASPSFYDHYTGLTAAPLALVAGVAAGALVRRRAVVVAAPLAAVVVIGSIGFDATPRDRAVPAVALQRAAGAVRGCVTADDPTLLALMDVLSRDLEEGCRTPVDVFGLQLVSGGTGTRYQRAVDAYLLSGAATIVSRDETALSSASAARIDRGRVLVSAAGWTLRAMR